MAQVTVCALLPIVVLTVGPSPAGALPSGFTEQTIFSGLDQPMAVEFSDDGRVFVAEKSGLVKVFDGLADPTPTTFADLRTQVHNFWDRGLMSIALAPDFPVDPSIYVLYAHDAAIGGTAPRWGSQGATSDPCPNPPGATADGCLISGRLSKLDATAPGGGTERVLIEDWCQQYPSHSVGDLEFGPDGYLYASGGDGASFNFVDYGQDGNPVNPCGDPPAGVGGTQTVPTAEGGALRSQDIQTLGDPMGLNGTVIRIDPATGEGAPGNPMISSADANARRVIATGLRNPFRLAPRTGTGELWIGDVGWSGWEEINRLSNPTDGTVDNFGWPCREGNGPMSSYNNGLTMCARIADGTVPTAGPHYTYAHGTPVVSGDGCASSSGSSVSGVTFYGGGAYPDAYDGALFFADYSRQCIWVMFPGANGEPDPTTRILFRQSGAFPVDLTIGPNGDLYYVDIAAGEVRRIRHTGTDQPPVAAISASPEQGGVPLTVSFSGAASSDPEGQPLTYDWDLDGDGAFDDATGVTATYTYTAAGAYDPAVRVSDPGGLTDVATRPILVGSTPPEPTISSPDASFTWAAGDDITFSGSATDPEDGTLPASVLSWDVTLQHCATVDSCHAHTLASFDAVSSGHFDAPGHDYPAYLELRLTATDSTGVSATTSRRLDPKVSTMTVETDPPGLTATVSTKTATTPFTAQGIVGSGLTLSTAATQTLNGATYEFDSWSHGGARVQDISVPAEDTTYRANFSQASGPVGGPVAAYSFDDGSGSTLADRTGNGHTGTISGATWSTAGKTGGALSFDGVNDLVSIADAADLDLTTDMTLEAWVRPTNNGGWRNVILKETASDLAYGLYSAGENGPSGWLDIGGWQVVTAPTAIPTPDWTHLAFTYDGAAMRIYVNGVQTASRAQTGGTTTSTSPLRLGGNTIWSEFYAGLLDDVRIYNRALTPTEIATDRDTPVAADTVPGDTEPPPPPEGGLIAAYSFDDGSGSTLADRTGNGHTGTVSGATWSTAGKTGGALSFDGVNDMVSIADAADLDLTTGMTLEAWVRPTDNGGWRNVILKETASDLAYGLYSAGPSGPSGWLFIDSWQVVMAATAIPTSAWTHLALTYDDTTIRLYVNGTEAATQAQTDAMTTSAAPLRLGGNTIWGEFYAGLLDDVRIYNRALTPTEITADRDTPVG